ncbi:MAG: hypothetical protein MUO40_10610 [Anaerolineaceae bacterium]|nr:hypothetical protein [Anaerolineaceae bacterium]
MDFEANSITDQSEINAELANTIDQEAKYRLGIVMRKDRGRYEVLSDNCRIPCAISNRLRKQLIYPTANQSSLRHAVVKVIAIENIDPLAIGDQVKFLDAGDGTGLIVEVLPRRNNTDAAHCCTHAYCACLRADHRCQHRPGCSGFCCS